MGALTKDLFREIKKSFGRFISIFSIVAIGVAFFAGVQGSAPIMKYSADRYFDDTNLMDIRVVSTWGFTKENLEAMKQIEGVAGIYPTYTMDVLTEKDTSQMVMKLLALPEKRDAENPDYINQVILTEGRYPENSGECLMESSTLFENPLQIGDTIELKSGTETELSESLTTCEYTIVGSVQTSYYLSFEKGTASIGSGDVYSFLYIPEANFTGERYTEVYLTVEDAKEKNSYTDAYFAITDKVTAELQAIGLEQADIQLTEQKEELQATLEENKATYESEKATFDEEIKKAEKELEDGKFELIKGEMALGAQKEAYETKMAQAKAELEKAEAELKASEETYIKNNENYQSLLLYGKNVLDRLEATLATLESNLTELQKQMAQLKENEELQQLEAQIAQTQADITSTQAQIAFLQQTADDAVAQLESAEAEIEAGKKELAKQKKRLEDESAVAEQALKDAEAELATAKADLESGTVTLEEKRAEGESALAEAQQALNDAEEQIAQLQGPEWYVLDRNSHYSYMDYGSAADRMAGIAQLFPVVFLLVAVLVCLTTMTRMVDEQRGTIGTLKALGYSTGKIATKYVSYAAIASVAGGIVGSAAGMLVFPTVIYNTWRIMYVMPDISLQLQPDLIVIGIAAAVLATTFATFLACYKELVETPALLMRPKAPRKGKKIFLERIPILWKHLSFSKKVTARNIFRYKKRFFMTVIGIAGCTALLLAGFGISDSVKHLVDLQYGKVYQYDATIAYEAGLEQEEKESFLQELQKEEWVNSVYTVTQQSASIEGEDGAVDLAAIIVKDPEEFVKFTSLHTRMLHEPLEMTGNKVILTEKIASNEGISVGDTISLAIGDNAYVSVEVSGITEHYVGHYVYLTETCYRTLYRVAPEPNLILVKTVELNQAEESVYAQKMMDREEVSSISFYSGVSASFQDTVSSLTIVTIVLVISAGLLAFVVLYNLTNVNISERLREIATIKVLGFYDKEVSAYVFRENIVLTMVGAAVGLFLGIWLHQFIMSMAELDTVMFGRSIDLLSYLFSFLLTMAFSLFVNMFMEPKLRRVPMVESLKSVE